MPFDPKTTLSIYGSHDAGACYMDQRGQLRVIEYERFVKRRYSMLSHMFDSSEGLELLRSNPQEREAFFSYLQRQLQHTVIRNIIYEELDQHDTDLLHTYFPEAGFHYCDYRHHRCHAAAGFFTSPYEEALIVSVDGGGGELGDVVTTKTFYGHTQNIFDLKTYDIDLGTPYALLGIPVSEISAPDNLFINLMSNSGKMMGLCAYGVVKEEWISPIMDFYSRSRSTPAMAGLEQLGNALQLDMGRNSLFGELSYNLAATSQRVFELLFDQYLWEDIAAHESKNIVLVGGCALNVLNNQRLRLRLQDIGKTLYVPPNPNDCGLAMGQFLYFTDQRISDSIAYNGIEITDAADFALYKLTHDPVQVTLPGLAALLAQGHIIGVIQDGSEVGPRALGNRSILCSASFADMKDKLNNNVKYREWFRPFAPVCRLEDASLYFYQATESPYMSFAPIVTRRGAQELPAITHHDGTARLQTVTAEQHPFLYGLLSELARQGDCPPVLLNTSFNIKGRPILSSYKDAIEVLEQTELDYVYSHGFLFQKIRRQ